MKGKTYPVSVHMLLYSVVLQKERLLLSLFMQGLQYWTIKLMFLVLRVQGSGHVPAGRS